ncbi:hypothetical protein, partial [Escherichia coli]|uniref:hypothetical protein n=1 Tax=Escherichia coli TaxID=562 RepID=UPI001BD54B97
STISAPQTSSGTARSALSRSRARLCAGTPKRPAAGSAKSRPSSAASRVPICQPPAQEAAQQVGEEDQQEEGQQDAGNLAAGEHPQRQVDLLA